MTSPATLLAEITALREQNTDLKDRLLKALRRAEKAEARAHYAEDLVAEYRDHSQPYWEKRAEAAEAELAQARKALEDIVSFYDGPTEAKRPDFFERLMNRARNALITGTEGDDMLRKTVKEYGALSEDQIRALKGEPK